MNLIKKIKHYFSFSPKEIQAMIVLIIAAAFMVTFKNWGEGDLFDMKIGLTNFLNGIILAGIAVFVHESAHKIAAAHRGYAAEHSPWYSGIGFGILMAFVTRGNLFYFGSSVLVYHLAAERLGTYKYGFRMKDVGFISLAGPLSNLALAVIFKGIYLINQSPLAEKAMIINIFFACFNMIPIPWVDGGNIFFAGRIVYSFFLAFIISTSVTLYFSYSIIAAIIVSALVAAIIAASWAFFGEGIVD